MAEDKKGAQEQAATLAFVDETGFSMVPPLHRTWSPKGQTPIIKPYVSRDRVNVVISVLSKADGSEGDILFFMWPRKVDSFVAVGFLQALHDEVEGPIVLVWDNLAVHCSGMVAKYIQENRDWLTVERFPTYAPELNPVEYANSALKTKDLANYAADRVEEIADKLEEAAERLVNKTGLIHGFLKASSLFTESELVT